jgi:hypothetical protein
LVLCKVSNCLFNISAVFVEISVHDFHQRLYCLSVSHLIMLVVFDAFALKASHTFRYNSLSSMVETSNAVVAVLFDFSSACNFPQVKSFPKILYCFCLRLLRFNSLSAMDGHDRPLKN